MWGSIIKIFFPPSGKEVFTSDFFFPQKNSPQTTHTPKTTFSPKKTFSLKKREVFCLNFEKWDSYVTKKKKNLKKGGVCLKKKVFSSRKRLFASILLLRGGFSSGKGMFTSKKRKVFIQLREISLKGNKTSNL